MIGMDQVSVEGMECEQLIRRSCKIRKLPGGNFVRIVELGVVPWDLNLM